MKNIMKNPLFYAVLISFLSFFIFGILIYNSVTDLKLQTMDSEAIQGKKVWENNGCIECHAVFGNGGYSAPDLTKIYQERGREWLEDFFRNPPLLGPSTKKNHPSLPDNKANQIIEYFRFISRTQLLNWPPKPLDLPEQEEKP